MTTRRIILLRHAKSSWAGSAADHERPLNDRGQRDAPRIGDALAAAGWRPELVVSSDAARTVETWRRMSPSFGERPIDARFSRDLYLAGLPELRAAARDWPDRHRTVMAIGHNPGWEGAASALSGEHVEMTTCNAVCLEGPAESWAAALEGRLAKILHLRPREL